jgi:hypothetical protein
VLPAIADRLTEHPVLVAEPVAHRGQLERRHRVEEAGREASQPSIPEPGVGLLLQQGEPVEPPFLGDAGDVSVQQEVGEVVGQRAPDQELQREVVDALGVFPRVGLI